MKKQILILISLLILIPILSIQASMANVDQQADNNITRNCTFTATEDTNNLGSLTDGSVHTVWKGKKGTTLKIESPKPIGAIYILWERAAATYFMISPDSKDTVTGGQNGFLSEFVPMKSPVHTLMLTFSEDSTGIDDIYVFGTGDIPGWVQKWKPMLTKADMLVLSAHSDDEFLWFGGTIPVYAGEYNKKVQVAYLIHHGKARNEYFRNHELLDGLWKAGVANYPMISSFEDYYSKSLYKEKRVLGKDNVLRYTVMLLRRFKPEVVVTHDANGEYGHAAHKLCAYAIKKSIPLSNDPTVYPDIVKEYGVWNIKKCYLHLYDKNSITMDWYKPLDAFGGKTGMDMAKLCYYQCYKSQSHSKKSCRVAEKNTKYDSSKFGLYYTAVGQDINKNDFFENISTANPPPAYSDPQQIEKNIKKINAEKYAAFGGAVLTLFAATSVLILKRRF